MIPRLENGSNLFKIEFLYDSEFPCKFSFFYHLPDVTTMDTFMTRSLDSLNKLVIGVLQYNILPQWDGQGAAIIQVRGRSGTEI